MTVPAAASREATAVAPHQLSVFELSYIGDAVYELWCRQHVLKAHTKAKEVNRAVFKWVRCQTQAAIVERWLADAQLDDTEVAIFQRGRNHRPNSKPKHATVKEYRTATGFECLVGYWFLSGSERFECLMDQVAVV